MVSAGLLVAVTVGLVVGSPSVGVSAYAMPSAKFPRPEQRVPTPRNDDTSLGSLFPSLLLSLLLCALSRRIALDFRAIADAHALGWSQCWSGRAAVRCQR